MRTRVAILGAGDLGRTLALHLRSQPAFELVGFLDDTINTPAVHSAPHLGGFADAAALFRDERFDALLIGVGYKHVLARQQIFDDLRGRGVPFASLVHPSCTVTPSAVVQEGAVLFPGCIVDEGSVIGANSVLNTGCVVAHDTRVGSHTFLGPGVALAGFVEVGVRCFLGIGTVVIDNIRIGDDVQTGGGTVVTRDLEPCVMAVGVPARVVRSGGAAGTP